MIIPLSEAIKINEDIYPEDLDAFESMVRELTNNNFQDTKVRVTNVSFEVPDRITIHTGDLTGFRVNDTIEVTGSTYNDGLYVIVAINENTFIVKGTETLISSSSNNAMITLVKYPPDIKRGVKKLIQYDKKMADKVGIKSETISRMSKTYYDVNASENIEGYPASLLSFLDKYKKMRWG
ncbi:hypothetical protein SAMN04488102_101359 [Alkalibacterium subtropicum]|uniref:Uncharacterized protein n=1 Tax=Alkalibacterium subtropicum TaxID=753702 RepID=A0A1I1EYW7_9LACT|nr:hypothetical protein [Alkalibacterium subtropicum]SFB90698.1 hypothetical protein SAMN04488102_101359 [Alkalibacterium subtropicum]